MGGWIQFVVLEFQLFPQASSQHFRKKNLSLEFHTSAATKISVGYVAQKEDLLFK